MNLREKNKMSVQSAHLAIFLEVSWHQTSLLWGHSTIVFCHPYGPYSPCGSPILFNAAVSTDLAVSGSLDLHYQWLKAWTHNHWGRMTFRETHHSVNELTLYFKHPCYWGRTGTTNPVCFSSVFQSLCFNEQPLSPKRKLLRHVITAVLLLE